MKNILILIVLVFLVTDAAWAQSRVICTVLIDADSGETLLQDGDCAYRESPASTFKIAISLMGYDAGILKSATEPTLTFKKEYIDWRQQWRQDTSPAYWMRESVVWYSQQITQRLGVERFATYVNAFNYGNKDVAGDPGKKNGLTNSWLSSSLRISPLEQVGFLRRMVHGELPVTADAVSRTAEITDYGRQPSGWHVHGKTGAGLPRNPDGSLRSQHPFGWFVGWAEKDGRTISFARLIEDEHRQPTPPSFRARDALLKEFFADPTTLD